jgi:hypothetical protein
VRILQQDAPDTCIHNKEASNITSLYLTLLAKNKRKEKKMP